MSELKRLSPSAIPAALAKAERYRLLNEPEQAESICEDVLAIEPSHAEATAMLILALTDQLGEGPHDRGRALARAQALAATVASEYQRAYFRGLIAERRARALVARGGAGSRAAAAEWLREAMERFAEAEPLRPQEDESAILRWNACARLLERYPELAERPAGGTEPVTSE
ncbi:MAG: hypothetical protein WD690_14245 [Vicinamibacterales bacterium]